MNWIQGEFHREDAQDEVAEIELAGELARKLGFPLEVVDQGVYQLDIPESHWFAEALERDGIAGIAVPDSKWTFTAEMP